MRVKLARLLIVLLMIGLWPVPAFADDHNLDSLPCTAESSLLVTEIQTTGSSSHLHEFIEIHNAGPSDIDLDGCRLDLYNDDDSDEPVDIELEGLIQAQDFVVVTYHTFESLMNGIEESKLLTFSGGSGLKKEHGSVVLSTIEESSIIDQVAYGDDPLFVPPPDTGNSIKRCSDENDFRKSDNLRDDFFKTERMLFQLGPECQVPDQDDDMPVSDCTGIVISEILPNAAGSDTGNEFIELYNPTAETINLNGCGLELAGSSSAFTFGDIQIGSGGYRAFSDLETDTTLPNASGGTIYLLSAENEELQEVTYPGGLDDDVAWTWFGLGDWEKTYAPTPGAANTRQPTKPCPAGQVRSETTGRCQKVASVQSSSLKPCDPDQFRNPETNRCKKKDSDSDLKPCKPDQERNPETNRCRSTSSAASRLKPCAPDQERNPETNRCRKVAGDNTSALGKVEDVETIPENSSNWWFAGIAATGATGYGLWEWRRDLRSWFSKGWAKVSGK